MIVLAIWLELSVSIVLYCGEIVALLIGAPRSRRMDDVRTPVPPAAPIGTEVAVPADAP